MKKFLSLIAVAVLTMVAWAAGGINCVAGETTVVENFTATGAGFKHNVDIDWSTQKVVAEIDLSTCSGTLENVFSIGKNIAEWNGTCYHLYYTAATSSLEVDFCTSSGNPIRVENITGISGTVKIEVVNDEGLSVNGTLYNKNTAGAVESSLSQLFALSSIQVGGCQGDNMSHATYNYIKVVNTATEPEPETGTKYTEPLLVNFAVGEGETGETKADPAYAMFNATADGGCEVTFNGVYALDGDNNSVKFGDIKLKFAEKSREVSSKGIVYDLYSNSDPTTVTITAADSEYNGVEFTLNPRFSKFITFTKDEQEHAYGMVYLIGEKNGEDLVLLLTFGETDPSAFEPEVTQVVDDMKVTFNGTTTPMTDKTMEVLTTAMDGFYDFNFKNFTIGTTVVGDLYIQGLLFEIDETTGEVTLDEEELDGEWSNVNALVGGALGLEDGDYASISTLKGSAKYNAEDGTFSDFHFTFTIADLNGSPVEVEFGKDTTVGINNVANTTFNGEAQIFSIDGVKLSRMQKGINIVRTAEGKTIKVIK